MVFFCIFFYISILVNAFILVLIQLLHFIVFYLGYDLVICLFVFNRTVTHFLIGKIIFHCLFERLLSCLWAAIVWNWKYYMNCDRKADYCDEICQWKWHGILCFLICGMPPMMTLTIGSINLKSNNSQALVNFR
jgi:hypothetical protein